MVLQDKCLPSCAPCFSEAQNVVYTDCFAVVSFQTHSFIPIPGQSPMAVGTLMRIFILKGFVPKTRTEFRVIGPMNHYTAAELPPLHLEFTVLSSSALSLHALHYLRSLHFHPFLFFSMTIHRKNTTLVNFLFFVVNHFKLKI